MNANRHPGSDRQRTIVPGSVPSDSSVTLPAPSPEGTSDNSPPFQRWVRTSEGIESRRDGRKEGLNSKALCRILSSLRDFLGFQDCLPSVETLGYFRVSLRDNDRWPGQGNFREALVLCQSAKGAAHTSLGQRPRPRPAKCQRAEGPSHKLASPAIGWSLARRRGMKRAFSPGNSRAPLPWGVAPGWYEAAPLALGRRACAPATPFPS